MKKKAIPFNMKKTDNLAVILFFIAYLVFGVINLIDKRTPLLSTGSVWFDSLITLGMFVVGMVCHECLHALGGIIFGKLKPSEVKFGIDKDSFNLYTHFTKPMKRGAYGLSLILPCVITALAPIAIVTALSGPIVLLSACLLFAGCAGDIVMFVSVMKEDKNALISDHPTALAYYLVYPENKLPEGFIELTEEEEKVLLKDSVAPAIGNKKIQRRNLLTKCLGILLFLAMYVLAMYLISLFMKNI